MKQLAQLALILTLALCATACVSPPAPKYQASIDNTGLLLKQNAKLAVGLFTAAAGVENHSLSIRGSQIKGGADGTFSTYLRDAVITELQTAGRYDESSKLQLTGTLTRNEISTGLAKTGTASVGGEFSLAKNGAVVFKKSFVAKHQWESSFIGAVAIPAAIDNYSTTVQKLLGELLSDPDFIASLR